MPEETVPSEWFGIGQRHVNYTLIPPLVGLNQRAESLLRADII